ncbi:MAG: hypothetical protein ACR2N3_17000 [Pyrinomonadaceae bacterium]
MKKHIIVIASIFIFLGTTIGIFFIYGHLQFLSVSSMLFADVNSSGGSVFDDNFSFLHRWRGYFNVYMNFFGRLGINPPTSIFTIVSSIAFGYGLLKLKEWARKLGFVIIALNVFACVYSIFNGFISWTIIVQLGLCAYMWWILTSSEVKSLIQTSKEKGEKL